VITSTLQVLLNSKEILFLDVSSQKQCSNIKIILNEEITFLLFAGLETESDAILQVSHHTSTTSEVVDAKLQLTLNHGNQIVTAAVWRNEMLLDIKNYLIRVISDLDMHNVEKFWADAEFAVGELEIASIHVLDDMFYITEINLSSIFEHIKEYNNILKDFLNSVPCVSLRLVNYMHHLFISMLDFG
jgi:hypothetical protein